MKVDEVLGTKVLTEEEQWMSDMDKALKGPFFTVPKGLTREERREWAARCVAGEIEADK